MTVQITVIGLGQLGVSIGLALAERTDLVYRVGHDRDMQIMNKVKALKAFDAVQFNLPGSVENADVILLCIPLDQIEETLKFIARDVREGAVVMDMAPAKAVVADWCQKYLPAGRHYVGLVPSISPTMLLDTVHGYEAARANLFEKATIGITAPQGTPLEAIKLAEDLTGLLGASPLLLDLAEADGMMAVAHLLPQAMAVALLNATAGQPGWQDVRRFAGRSYALGTAPLGDETLEALELALRLNPEQMAQGLTLAIGALTYLRDSLKNNDPADLTRRLRLAFDDHNTWLKERNAAEWEKVEKSDLPGAGAIFQRLFTGERPKKK